MQCLYYRSVSTRLRLLACALGLFLANPESVFAQDPIALFERYQFQSIAQPQLPYLSEGTAKSWVALHETTIVPPRDGATVKEIFEAVRRALATHPYGKECVLHVGRWDWLQEEFDLNSPVDSRFHAGEPVSIDRYLRSTFPRLYHVDSVRENLIFFTWHCDDCPHARQPSQANARTWVRLHQRIPVEFPGETPLSVVTKSLEMATRSRADADDGLRFKFQKSLQDGEPQPENHEITLEVRGVELCTTLNLMLSQVGLSYSVGSDGVITIGPLRYHHGPRDSFEVMFEYMLSEYARYASERYSRLDFREMSAELQNLRKQLEAARNSGAAPVAPTQREK